MSSKGLILGIILEERFCRLPDGGVYSPSGYGNDFWQRYLQEFEQVVIIARLAPVQRVEHAWAKIAHPRVTIRGVAPYLGPAQLINHFPAVWQSFRFACRGVDALIVRAPGTLSLLALLSSYRPWGTPAPTAVELVGDPDDVFSVGVGGRLSKIFKYIFRWSTRKICVKADAVLYVTERILQARYPTRRGVISSGCSDVALAADNFVSGPRRYDLNSFGVRLPTGFTAASLEVPYKGIDVMIVALAQLTAADKPFNIRVAGDGRLRIELEELAARLGVASQIIFLGRLNRSEVMEEMRKADLYLQPSLTEGLPRAIVEACATGAPVIATRVGGIPEILDSSDMVSPGDSTQLAERIITVLADPDRMRAMSVRNMATAQKYTATFLDARRRRFYAEFRQIARRRNKV